MIRLPVVRMKGFFVSKNKFIKKFVRFVRDLHQEHTKDNGRGTINTAIGRISTYLFIFFFASWSLQMRVR